MPIFTAFRHRSGQRAGRITFACHALARRTPEAISGRPRSYFSPSGAHVHRWVISVFPHAGERGVQVRAALRLGFENGNAAAQRQRFGREKKPANCQMCGQHFGVARRSTLRNAGVPGHVGLVLEPRQVFRPAFGRQRFSKSLATVLHRRRDAPRRHHRRHSAPAAGAAQSHREAGDVPILFQIRGTR